jgi:ubiquinone/menaquinone biosynthesis C-methylase UbiE
MNKYSFAKYNYVERWISYWHQIDEVNRLKPGQMLEIGPGNNFVNDYLRRIGYSIKTLDVNNDNQPDVVGSVLELPFNDNSFDLILCSEVLEHLPFFNFKQALGELERVSKKYVILSLPRWGWLFYVKLKLPFFKHIKLYFKLSGFKKHKSGGEHFWEIGKTGYPLKKIKHLIKEQKFKIIKEYLDPDSPYHHFFILEK